MPDEKLAGGSTRKRRNKLGKIPLGRDPKGLVSEKFPVRWQIRFIACFSIEGNIDDPVLLEVSGEEGALQGGIGFAEGKDDENVDGSECVGEEKQSTSSNS